MTAYRLPLLVTTAVFFMWGFLTSLNDVLIPHLKAVFDLDYTRAMLVQFTFFGAYFLVSLPAGRFVDRLGYQRGIVAGLLLAGIGALLFLPAARAQSYPLFLTALFVLAAGITLLQVAANPYVSLLGEPARAPSRLTLAQALNSLGHTIGPAVGGLTILSVAVLGADALAALSPADRAAYRAAQAASVQLPYLVLAGILFALALFVYLFRLPHLQESAAAGAAPEAAKRESFSVLLRIPHLRFAVIGIFVYVGAEVAIGSLLINYLNDPRIGNMSEASAANYVSYYWGGAMLGRFAGSLLLRRLAAPRLLSLFALAAGALLLVTMGSGGAVAVWSVVAVGLFNSILFPTLFTLGIAGLGERTAAASSLLVMAIVGGALIPQLTGVLADAYGVQAAFALPLLCYVYIVWFGAWALRHERTAAA